MHLDKKLAQLWLCVLDFDGNIARTFDPSPNQMNVNHAYNLAIQYLFGAETFGHDPLALIGGLKNRAPSEIIGALFQLNRDLLLRCKKIFASQTEILKDFVPAGKGVPLIWDETQTYLNPQRLMAELLVRAKLLFLMKEINEYWPLPCTGFIDFIQALPRLEEKTKIKPVTAILSSGHDEFIHNVYKIWGIPQPELMITDDDLRTLNFPSEPERTVKPSPFLLDLVLVQWLAKQPECEPDNTNLTQFLAMAKKRTIYFGDDPIKDGLLAKNAGVIFGWFNPLGKTATDLGEHFVFSDWRQVPAIATDLLGLA
jgi:hypothetical protein